MASTASLSEKGQLDVHLSQMTAVLLKKRFLEEMRVREGLMLSKRGEGMLIKGKGMMRTFSWRNSRCMVPGTDNRPAVAPTKSPKKMWEGLDVERVASSCEQSMLSMSSCEESICCEGSLSDEETASASASMAGNVTPNGWSQS